MIAPRKHNHVAAASIGSHVAFLHPGSSRAPAPSGCGNKSTEPGTLRGIRSRLGDPGGLSGGPSSRLASADLVFPNRPGEREASALRAVRRDTHTHPSPAAIRNSSLHVFCVGENSCTGFYPRAGTRRAKPLPLPGVNYVSLPDPRVRVNGSSTRLSRSAGAKTPAISFICSPAGRCHPAARSARGMPISAESRRSHSCGSYCDPLTANHFLRPSWAIARLAGTSICAAPNSVRVSQKQNFAKLSPPRQGDDRNVHLQLRQAPRDAVLRLRRGWLLHHELRAISTCSTDTQRGVWYGSQGPQRKGRKRFGADDRSLAEQSSRLDQSLSERAIALLSMEKRLPCGGETAASMKRRASRLAARWSARLYRLGETVGSANVSTDVTAGETALNPNTSPASSDGQSGCFVSSGSAVRLRRRAPSSRGGVEGHARYGAPLGNGYRMAASLRNNLQSGTEAGIKPGPRETHSVRKQRLRHSHPGKGRSRIAHSCTGAIAGVLDRRNRRHWFTDSRRLFAS